LFEAALDSVFPHGGASANAAAMEAVSEIKDPSDGEHIRRRMEG
jgi:hypothetical protein